MKQRGKDNHSRKQKDVSEVCDKTKSNNLICVLSDN